MLAMLFSLAENANTEIGECLMVDLELDGELAVITIDRPHARNAISLDTMDALNAALDGAAGARALAITGAGDKAFVSGGDLKELALLRTELEAAEMAWRMRTICDRIAGFPGPVIAALNGHALGGGAEVAVAADIRIAADDIRIGFNQISLGRCGAPRRTRRSQSGAAVGRHRTRAGCRDGRAGRPDRPGGATRHIRRHLA